MNEAGLVAIILVVGMFGLMAIGVSVSISIGLPSAVCLVISYALSLAAYFTGEFNATYLYMDLVFIAVGLGCAWLFAARPSPRLAYALTIVFMMGEGLLICLAMILGSL